MSGFCNLYAQNAKFKTDLLESLAEKIQFLPKLGQKNMSIEAGVLHNQPLYANINDKGTITHIGFRLFPEIGRAHV